jgi:hypothetical protein
MLELRSTRWRRTGGGFWPSRPSWNSCCLRKSRHIFNPVRSTTPPSLNGPFPWPGNPHGSRKQSETCRQCWPYFSIYLYAWFYCSHACLVQLHCTYYKSRTTKPPCCSTKVHVTKLLPIHHHPRSTYYVSSGVQWSPLRRGPHVIPEP